MVLLTMVLTKYALIESLVNPIYLKTSQFLILGISVISITAGGYIINDIFDVETDKINKPKNVFIGRNIKLRTAIISYISLTSFGLILATYLSYIRNSLSLISFFAFSILSLFFYSYNLKKRTLIGNILISILCSLPILLVYLFHSDYTTRSVGDGILLYYVVIIYAIFSFLTTFIREIIKDIEDINGDLKIKAKTLPIIMGRKRAAKIAFLFTCILFFFILILLLSFKNKIYFVSYGLIFILFPLIIFMFKLYLAETKERFSKLSNTMKVIMFFGILSMLLFKFI
ncbi:geranylgeranylglycerol-phosphate geranylgeranyltransferase [Polaribacter sp. Asnod1-A03]|uniref:geranylgeranylglycerol-phosphate geranylgeranyltransferase n=1 Tax=Polaribacter sp. Asnod1-A03 TaxID=3160581 RepID=UPI00386A893B